MNPARQLWADSHCHIHDARLDAGACVAAAREQGVGLMVTVGCDELTTQAAINVASVEHVAPVWATAGLHPHDATDGLEWIRPVLDRAEELRIVGVGECGLDYYYEHSPRDVQQRIFAEQIQLAHEYHLPLVIHTRDAWDDTFAVMATEGTPSTTIFHCFSGGPEEAAACMALGAGVYLSYSGIVTFNTAEELRAAAAITPLERMLVETDSPYLAPIPYRGKKNQPAYVPFVGTRIAEVKGLPVDQVARGTFAATTRAFGLSEDGSQRGKSHA